MSESMFKRKIKSMKGVGYIQTSKSSSEINNAQPHRFIKRIGSTTYRVTIHFPEKETESLKNKILRMMKNDLKLGVKNGKIELPQADTLPERGSL